MPGNTWNNYLFQTFVMAHPLTVDDVDCNINKAFLLNLQVYKKNRRTRVMAGELLTAVTHGTTTQ